MDNFRIAVKAFIVKDGRALLLKRRGSDVHKPGQWDIPGGRLEPGENPLTGVKRETKEETNLGIEVCLPLDVQHFVRDDGQKITMIIFLCRPLSKTVKLSEEHEEYKWMDIAVTRDAFPRWLYPVLDNLVKINFDKL